MPLPAHKTRLWVPIAKGWLRAKNGRYPFFQPARGSAILVSMENITSWLQLKTILVETWMSKDYEDLIESLAADLVVNDIEDLELLVDKFNLHQIELLINPIAANNTISLIMLLLRVRPSSSKGHLLEQFSRYPQKPVAAYARTAIWRRDDFNSGQNLTPEARESMLARLKELEFLNRNTTKSKVIETLVSHTAEILETGQLAEGRRLFMKVDLKYSRLVALGNWIERGA